MTGARRRSLLTLLALGLCPIASLAGAGESVDLARLMQLLAATPSGAVAFTEKKFSSLLTEPVTSSGTLSYRRPDAVEKIIDTPRKERYLFAGDELTVVRKGVERKIRLSSQPLLAAFAASLRGVLAGDADLLRSYFRLDLSGSESAWRLELTPLDGEIGRYVQGMTMSGHGGQLEQIEVREASGDHSAMQIKPASK